MRLVVCVDRDDDLGRKAGVQGPVVGRQNVLDAALKLGVADPEDADTNAMLAAVRVHDELRRAGDDCEVVVLTGSPKVGLLSDRRVAEQFDRVLVDHPADAAHLVSDGAEDEYLFPILSSRVRIDGVHRVFIRQSASLESTYYTLVRALKDPKLRAKTVLPFALVLLILGVAAAGGVIWWGVTGLAILLGIYLIFWTFDIDEAIIDSIRSASTDVRQGSAAFGIGFTAIALVAIGFLQGYNLYIAHPAETPIIRFLLFCQAGLIWWLFGAEVWETGRAVRRYLLRGRISRAYPIATTSIIGMGLVAYGIVFLVQYLEAYQPPAQLPAIIGGIGVGLALVVGAGALQLYLRSRSARADVGSAPG
jgi:putative membrane protein